MWFDKKNRKKIWEPHHEVAFDEIKQIVSKETMLYVSKLGEPFKTYTDASDHQLGAVVSQNGKPIAFFSRKLTPTQQKYIVGERNDGYSWDSTGL